MKKLLLFSFLLYNVLLHSQISVSENLYRKTKELNSETLDRFKKTTTIFVLPSVIQKEIYTEILKEHWKITPFEIVDYKEFTFKKYLKDTYSFVYLNTAVKTIEKARAINVYLFTSLDVFMLDNEKIKPLLNSKKKRHNDLILKNKKQLASIILYPKNDHLRAITNLRKNPKKVRNHTYSKHSFYDLNPGFFKNGIQKINHQFTKEETYYLYKNDFLPEIKELKNHKLYVPEYLGIKFNGMRETNLGKNVDYINELFKNYDYTYEIINSATLSNKIIAKEIRYYVKYTRINTQRFLHVTNALTGEIIYRKHMSGLAYNLHGKHILNLNNTIRKTSENQF